MKVVKYTVVETPSFILTIRRVQCEKDDNSEERKFKITYDISIYNRHTEKHLSEPFHKREDAIGEWIRLLRLHTNMTKTEILRGLWK